MASISVFLKGGTCMTIAKYQCRLPACLLGISSRQTHTKFAPSQGEVYSLQYIHTDCKKCNCLCPPNYYIRIQQDPNMDISYQDRHKLCSCESNCQDILSMIIQSCGSGVTPALPDPMPEKRC